MEQADDLRAQALYECLVFDTVLDSGNPYSQTHARMHTNTFAFML